jgi:RNA polymerase sigma-70 factor, ECF subfamily
MMAVVKNACLHILRPFQRERRTLGARIDDESQIESTEPNAQDALERWELVQAVHRGIAGLERPYREVLAIRDVKGLTGAATSRALGIEIPLMKTRLHRARTQLRVALLSQQSQTSVRSP